MKMLTTRFLPDYKLKNIPDNLKEDDPYIYEQLVTIQTGLLFAIFTLSIITIVHISLKNILMYTSSSVTLMLTIIAYTVNKRDPLKWKYLISNLLISFIYTTALTVIITTGGIQSPAVIWLIMFPPYMIMVNGYKNGIFWLLISSLLFVVLLFLEHRISIPVNIIFNFSGYIINYTVVALFTLYLLTSLDLLKKRTLIKLREAQSQLQLQATTDSLTGLYNRRFLFERAESEINRSVRHNSPISVVMADLDFFKKINDNHGHIAGDTILVEVSKIIRKSLRTIDISGRYGGEEFIIILPETDQKESFHVAERIRRSIEQHNFIIDDSTVSITISLGIATITPDDNDSLDTLINHADIALYKSKDTGRNKTTITQGIDE